MLDETTSLRDTLETAMDAVAPEENSSVETEATQDFNAERARDEAGRFARAELDAQVEQGEIPKAPRLARPSSWKKDYQGKWDQIADTDPQMATYLLEREQQYATGVSTYKAEADRAHSIQATLEPHSARFQEYGVDTVEYLNKLLHMDEILAKGTPQQQMALLQSIARSVGLTGEEGAESAQNTEHYQQKGGVSPDLLNTVYGLQNKLQAIEQANERAEQARVNVEIDSFAETAPYLDDVKDTMAQLLETGFASDLKDAYDKALRWNDGLFQKHQAEQQQGAEAQRRMAAQATVARARSAAVSPRTSTPTGAVTASTQGGDMRSAVEAGMDRVLGARGRI